MFECTAALPHLHSPAVAVCVCVCGGGGAMCGWCSAHGEEHLGCPRGRMEIAEIEGEHEEAMRRGGNGAETMDEEKGFLATCCSAVE